MYICICIFMFVCGWLKSVTKRKAYTKKKIKNKNNNKKSPNQKVTNYHYNVRQSNEPKKLRFNCCWCCCYCFWWLELQSKVYNAKKKTQNYVINVIWPNSFIRTLHSKHLQHLLTDIRKDGRTTVGLTNVRFHWFFFERFHYIESR